MTISFKEAQERRQAQALSAERTRNALSRTLCKIDAAIDAASRADEAPTVGRLIASLQQTKSLLLSELERLKRPSAASQMLCSPFFETPC